ncbi:alpha-hydroxy acid oxidase [Halomonas alkalisoli]|uniref:alpha-hydroxy acid oxidase n=1 Tax=Halomonas alkalisoli TaxID=2907158 RepID=UPI001F3A9F20|nr:alpha-hydroxy acid oxidase [Halomonas alkalisoli]MCE9681679.1 alpha-hydroxy-acid oxidizing protein [Halomonas alkalisoli]
MISHHNGRGKEPRTTRWAEWLNRRRLSHILSLDDFQDAARRHLPRPIFAYLAGGAEDNRSCAANRSSFSDFWFKPKVLVDVSARCLETSLLGSHYAAPFGVSPLGLSALYAYRGDIVLSQAARSMELPMVMSGSSLIPLEEVAAVNPQAWFQAYLPGTWGESEALIERIGRAGFETLVITVDTPVAANRENNTRAGFSTPIRPSLRLAWDGVSRPRWLFGTFMKTIRHHGLPHFENNYVTRGAPILSKHVERDISNRGNLEWGRLSRIRQLWPGQLVIKGVLCPDDARRACEAGADGLIVSNHGGRQLDGAIPPLWVLPAIVAACPEVPVMYDSGVRRGSDVLKALALGARFVFVGRPFGFAAAYAGEAGVVHAMELLKEEISRNMALLGVTSVSQLDRSQLMTHGQALQDYG